MATTTKKARTSAPTVALTLSTFDYGGRPVYRTLREGVKLSKFKAITATDYSPAGGTPLLDATVQFISHLRGLASKSAVQIGLLLDESGSMRPNQGAVIESVNRFVDGLREVDAVDPAVAGKGFLVIATDGEENQSREATYEDVSRLVKECEDAGWVTVFLGASIDGWAQGRRMGLSGTVYGQTVSTENTPAGTSSGMAYATQSAVGYLGDNDTYLRSAKGQSSVLASGAVLDSNIGAAPMSVSPPPTDLGEYDPTDALKKVRKRS